MDTVPLSALFIALFILLLLSAFFSGSETGLMMLNRYRLRHLVDKQHPGARRAQQLLDRPDRLIGLILLGNNLVNVLASMLTTLIALRIAGEPGMAVAAGLLVLVILIFSEVTPKTLAALHPERIAFPAAFIYIPLLKIFYPLVWLVNAITNNLLKLLGVPTDEQHQHALSAEELRTVVKEAGALIHETHQTMLLNLIDLEKVTVEDVMVPRNEVTGIDLTDDWETITRQLSESHYTRLPVYRESIDRVIGILHMRDVMPLLYRGELDADTLQGIMREPYFIPENTPLNRQLLNFRREQRRTAFVVDEYGDLQGLVALVDILEEVVGEFTTDPADRHEVIVPQEDGSWLVDGSTSIRNLNATLHMSLSTDGPKTLNGLITEYLETIPDAGTSLLLDRRPVDIVRIQDNMIKTVRIHAPLTDKRAGAPGEGA